MNFFRNFNTETNMAIFIAGICLFFITSSAISVVKADSNQTDTLYESTIDESLSDHTPLYDGSPPDGTIIAPTDPDADGPGYESPGAEREPTGRTERLVDGSLCVF